VQLTIHLSEASPQLVSKLTTTSERETSTKLKKEKGHFMEKEESIIKLGDFFKVMGDSTRLKIINLLFEQELCVCDLAEKMNMNQPAVSQQLKTLRNANLIKYRKEGKHIFYSLSDDHVKQIFDQGMIHICDYL
jgi:ArsR family transcriptional regulator